MLNLEFKPVSPLKVLVVRSFSFAAAIMGFWFLSCCGTLRHLNPSHRPIQEGFQGNQVLKLEFSAHREPLAVPSCPSVQAVCWVIPPAEQTRLPVPRPAHLDLTAGQLSLPTTDSPFLSSVET